jgi:hypothetical protein
VLNDQEWQVHLAKLLYDKECPERQLRSPCDCKHALQRKQTQGVVAFQWFSLLQGRTELAQLMDKGCSIHHHWQRDKA